MFSESTCQQDEFQLAQKTLCRKVPGYSSAGPSTPDLRIWGWDKGAVGQEKWHEPKTRCIKWQSQEGLSPRNLSAAPERAKGQL